MKSFIKKNKKKIIIVLILLIIITILGFKINLYLHIKELEGIYDTGNNTYKDDNEYSVMINDEINENNKKNGIYCNSNRYFILNYLPEGFEDSGGKYANSKKYINKKNNTSIYLGCAGSYLDSYQSIFEEYKYLKKHISNYEGLEKEILINKSIHNDYELFKYIKDHPMKAKSSFFEPYIELYMYEGILFPVMLELSIPQHIIFLNTDRQIVLYDDADELLFSIPSKYDKASYYIRITKDKSLPQEEIQKVLNNLTIKE